MRTSTATSKIVGERGAVSRMKFSEGPALDVDVVVFAVGVRPRDELAREAGLKASGAPDLALVRVLGPEHTAAAVFTRNRFAAAPVLWSREVVSDGRADAVVLNSGGANACTGPEGFAAAHRTAEAAAEHLGIAAPEATPGP